MTAASSNILAPRETPDLVGHEEAEARLRTAWDSGRLPHGWLIAGPRGIGKATLAFRFARFVLADEGSRTPKSLAIDANSPLFKRIASGGHADLATLEPGFDTERKRRRDLILVDEVRAATRLLSLTAAEGRWRVIVVDAAEQMNAPAANALLKLLEEPPRRALLLLVSHAPGRLPATVRSRLCKLVLHPLPRAAVAGLVRRHRPELDDAAVEALAALAEGSPGRALALAELGGVELLGELLALFDQLPKLDTEALHRLADRLARPAAAEGYRTATGLLVWWLARLVRLGAGAPADEVAPGEGALIRRLVNGSSLESWLEVWDKVSRLVAQAESKNLDRKQVVMSAFFAIETAARA